MFTRKKITIPASGQSEIFSFDGVSLIVESMPTYSVPEQVPTLAFDDSSASPQPLYPQSTYTSRNGFNRISITGTDESAGDVIFVLSTDSCLNEKININSSVTSRPTLKATFKETVSDEVKELTEFQLINDSLVLPSAMYVTAIDSKVHFAFDIDPEQGAGALGHVILENETVKIIGVNFIKGFRYINAVNATDAIVNFTLEY